MGGLVISKLCTQGGSETINKMLLKREEEISETKSSLNVLGAQSKIDFEGGMYGRPGAML